MNFYRPSDYDRVMSAAQFRRARRDIGIIVYTLAVLLIGYWLGWGTAVWLLP